MKNFLKLIVCCVIGALITVGINKLLNKPDKVTFTEQIAPIIYKNCTTCHRPGSDAPFDLITYNDVRKRSKMIQKVTESKFMPPWPADASYSHFADEKVLSDGD